MKAKQRRFREGYEDGISTTHKAMSAATFILRQAFSICRQRDGLFGWTGSDDRSRRPLACSESPVELLGKHTQILLDGPQSETVAEPASDGDTQKTSLGRPEEAARVAELARTSDATTTEVRSLCGDLQVLGRSELKQLLRWRLALRRHVDKWRKDADKVEADGLKEGEAADGEGEVQMQRWIKMRRRRVMPVANGDIREYVVPLTFRSYAGRDGCWGSGAAEGDGGGEAQDGGAPEAGPQAAEGDEEEGKDSGGSGPHGWRRGPGHGAVRPQGDQESKERPGGDGGAHA